MSVKDINKELIVSDCLNGRVIDIIPMSVYDDITITDMIKDIMYDFVFDNEHGIMIKIGYKS